jgi:hypothetical protein
MVLEKPSTKRFQWIIRVTNTAIRTLLSCKSSVYDVHYHTSNDTATVPSQKLSDTRTTQTVQGGRPFHRERGDQARLSWWKTKTQEEPAAQVTESRLSRCREHEVGVGVGVGTAEILEVASP